MKLLHTCLTLLAILGGGVRAKSVGRLKHQPVIPQQSVVAPPPVPAPAPAAADSPASAASMHPSIEEDDPFYDDDDDDDWDLRDLEESEGLGGGVGEEEGEEGEQLGDGDRALLEALRRRYKDDPRLSPAAAAAVAAGQAPEIFTFEDFTMARNDDPSILFAHVSPDISGNGPAADGAANDIPAFASPDIPAARGKDAEELRLSRVRRQPPSSDVKYSTADEPDAFFLDLIPRVESQRAATKAPEVPPLPSPATALAPAQATAPASVLPMPQPDPVPAPELTDDHLALDPVLERQDDAPVPPPLHVHSPHFVVAHAHDSAVAATHGMDLCEEAQEEEERLKSPCGAKGGIESSNAGGETPTDAEVAEAQSSPPPPPQLTQAHIDALFDVLSNIAHVPVSVAYVPISGDLAAPASRDVYDDRPTSPDADRTVRAVDGLNAPPPLLVAGVPPARTLMQLLRGGLPSVGAGAGAGTGAEAAKEETELERALRRQRTIEKLIHAVKIAGHVESYLTNRARHAFKTLAHVYDLDYDDRQLRARRSRGRSFI